MLGSSGGGTSGLLQLVLLALWRRLMKPIAERPLVDTETGDTVFVRFFEPVKQDLDWVCTYQVKELEIEGEGHGVDSLQALIIAIELARQALERCGRSLTWYDHEPGDIGIPKSVPTIADRAEQLRINKWIDDEINRWSEARLRERRSRKR